MSVQDPETTPVRRARASRTGKPRLRAGAGSGELIDAFGAPVSHWMIDAVAPQPGERVLELAAGLGETGLLAAELVAPGGRGDHLRPGRGDARRRPRARRRARARERRVPGAERRVDRPAARERGHRALPLGLHADGRPGRGARARPGACSPRAGAWRSPCGTRSSATRGPRCPGRSWPSTGWARRGLGRSAAGVSRRRASRRSRRWAAAQQPGPFALGDAGRFAELLGGRGLHRGLGRGPRARPPPPELRGVLGHDARHLARSSTTPRCRSPRPRSTRSARACGGALRPTPTADGTLQIPGRTLVAKASA